MTKNTNNNQRLSYPAFLKRVKDTVKQYGMLEKGDRILAAVSGGADSVSLLKVLLSISEEWGCEVVVGNIDHSFRGMESRRESEFVKKLSKNLNVKFCHKKINAKKGDESISEEERARVMRYRVLKKFARENNCNIIAMGHNMDDQAETVLMRVIYGCSLAGLVGIPPVRCEGRYKIIRPLIRTERRDIIKFLRDAELNYVTDSSNLDTSFVRNKIRIKILPFLEKYNPKLRRTLVNLSDALREDLDFLNSEKNKKFDIYMKESEKKNRTFSIKTNDILVEPAFLRREIFKELFKRAGGNVKKLTYRHWMDMDLFAKTAVKGKSLDLPGRVKLCKTDKVNLKFQQ